MTDESPHNRKDSLAELAYPLNADSPYAIPIIEKGNRTAFQLIHTSGLTPQTIEALIPTVLQEIADRDQIPVFVGELASIDVFRRSGVIFEILPDVAVGQATLPQLRWHTRRAQCLALIEAKWKPQGITRLGDASEGDP